MSPQLKSFEGPDVQLVLDRIRQELGPDAKINGAEKIRVGGVLGFFAKEHYRVLVEAPDVEPAASPAASALGTSTNGADVFSAMAEATDEVKEVASSGWVPIPRQPLAPAPVAQPPMQPPTQAPATAPPPPPPLVPAAEAADDDTDSFDTVLSRVAHILGDSPVDSPAGAATSGPSDIGAVSGADDADTGDGSGPDIAARAALYVAETTGEPTDPRIDALRSAGLDVATVAAVAEGLHQGAGLEALLVATFGRLDPAPLPPRLAGSLLVVVGQGAGARRLAMALASEIGGDPAAVAFCSLHLDTGPTGSVGPARGDPLVVGSAEEAAELAPGWRRSGPAVVAVDCAVTTPVRSWATGVIGALRPTAVWGVVDATAKCEDVSAWAGSLGGLDALAVENLDATVSPAASLAAGIPVARLDGRPANAARWTATIVDRVMQP